MLRVPAALHFQPPADVVARFGGPYPPVDPGRSITVWTFRGRTLAPAAVTTGITDSVYTEILAAPVAKELRLLGWP
ncbi:MAG TPA: hypothetical protein VFT39_15335 [Vicinamibacterales bacterium]|nr:hypothetical protein [Vicinamibacterales bacterium]